MSVINILSPHVADLIAAGEVVERPASVVKELIENSFDAGAKNIICEIRNGGTTYIRVTDDGCGMSPDDAGIAFTRHATSKLADESGLECIGTMGFRGEALAAISSVSHIELYTRQTGSSEGTRVLLDGGDIQDMGPFGCPVGTTMIVTDIFYNTPARQKFMKSDRSEASACIAAAMRCALGRPDVSVRLIRDGDDEFFSPGDGRIDSCLYALLGREEASTMLQCSSSSDGMKLSGYISSPSSCRGNRAHQFFFVNGRFVKSQIMQAALEQAYRNSLLSGHYPSCVMYLDIPYGSVDVNVHPAKTEVRFGSEKSVFDFIYHAAKFALEGEDRLAPATKEDIPEKRSDPAYRVPDSVSTSGRFSAEHTSYGHQTSIDLPGSGSTGAGNENVIFHPTVHHSQKAENSSYTAPSGVSSGKNVEKPVQNVENPDAHTHNILGEAFKTYIAVEQNGEIILIDKHAAHERMIFDRLRGKTEEIPSQLLLSPETVRLSYEDSEILENNAELLASLGFEIEPFGEATYIVRGVPADMIPGDAAASIEEICGKIRLGASPDPAEIRDDVLHTVACKAAIKAGWNTTRPELEAIVDAVCSGKIRYCPHGRPLSAVITRTDLDKLFKRIV